MMVFPDQEVPQLIPTAVNHTFDSLHEDWCYQYTRFRVDQLRCLHDLLQLPPVFIIHGDRSHSSSEEGFIITMVKLAMGFCNTTLCYYFGEPCHQPIADIYRHIIALLDDKAHGILHGVDVMHQWVEHFPTFSSTIKRNLAERLII
jgi:hypothetical protein